MKIKKTGRTWSIVDSAGVIFEGGFFTRVGAEQALALYEAEERVRAQEARRDHVETEREP
jgi:hypothetical protein